MENYLIEVLDYNEVVLKTNVVKNITKEDAVRIGTEMCSQVEHSYCFNVESVKI